MDRWPPEATCKFFLRGNCRFGNKCWNSHSTTKRIRTPVSTTICKSISDYINNDQVASTSANIHEKEHSVAEPEVMPQCGICFENISDKDNPRDQAFGLLPNCNHCFCYGCIITWRRSKEFDKEVSNSCPECRITSDIVYWSKTWMVESEEKTLFINNQIEKKKQKDCRNFKMGNGKCPFGNKCYYRHALWSGELVDLGEPKPRTFGVLRMNGLDALEQMFQQEYQWEDEVDDDLSEVLSFDNYLYDGDDDSGDFDDEDFEIFGYEEVFIH